MAKKDIILMQHLLPQLRLLRKDVQKGAHDFFRLTLFSRILERGRLIFNVSRSQDKDKKKLTRST